MDTQWIDKMIQEDREELLEGLDWCFDEEQKLAHVWRALKENEVFHQDYFVEFSSDEDGNITGAVFVYNLQADDVNLTIPIWGTQVQDAFEKDTNIEKFHAVQELLEGLKAKLAPYIEAAQVIV